MKIKRDRRPFWAAFGVTLFLLVILLGIFTVDYQGRKLSFGDDTPLFRVEKTEKGSTLVVKAFGSERSWDVTELAHLWEMAMDFGCIPHRGEQQEGFETENSGVSFGG